MAKEKPETLEIKTFSDHHVITQPNPLRKVLRRVEEKDLDDPRREDQNHPRYGLHVHATARRCRITVLFNKLLIDGERRANVANLPVRSYDPNH